MQIAIDILEEKYQWIKEHKGVTDFQTTQMLYDAVRNAVVLPKGHGRLIDADKLKQEILKYCSDIFDLLERRGAKLAEIHYNDLIDNAPTVISEDKEVE